MFPNTKISQHQIQDTTKLDFDDIIITPFSITEINSRKQVNPFYKNNSGMQFKQMLPLFTAPMDTVSGIDSMFAFGRSKINVVLPRTVSTKYHSVFNSFGLNDVISENHKDFAHLKDGFVLLDVANGHMRDVIRWCENLKKIMPNVTIMAGNIANPATFKIYSESGVIDFARVGIGNGNGCLTTQQTGIGYPMASLIMECNEIKKQYETTKIVADGGMKKYSDIIKALALGADYVMVGSIFSKALESSGDVYWKSFKLNRKYRDLFYSWGFDLHKEFRGMSTKQAQKALGNKVLKTSEGVVRKVKIEYTIEQWASNFTDYLRSAMSYTGSETLEEFIGCVDYTTISTNAFNRFNK